MSGLAIRGNVLTFPRVLCVYLLTNSVNGKVYVGKASDLKERWSQHRYEARKLRGRRTHTSPIHLAINKYGEDAFSVEPIEWCATHDDAYAAEEFWIEWYRSFDGRWGYNASRGGEGSGGHVQSPELIERRIGKIRGRKQTSELVSARMASRMGVTPEEYVARRAVGDLRCSGLGAREPHWIRPEDSYGTQRPTSASCRDCFNAHRRRQNAAKPKSPRKPPPPRTPIWNARVAAKRIGIPVEEYVSMTANGLRYCSGKGVNQRHWCAPTEMAPQSSFCRACARDYGTARRKRAA